MRFLKTLYGQVLVATVIGLVVGRLWPDAGVAMRPLGDAFIKIVRMIIAPVIFCAVVVGIAGAGAKTVGKAGVLALVYFEVVTTFALVLGLVAVNVIRPGEGMNVDVTTLATWLDYSGHPHTDMLHVVEKFSRPTKSVLHYEAMIDDPGAYTRPWTVAWNIPWRANGEVAEYICQENNQYLLRLTDDFGRPLFGRRPQ